MTQSEARALAQRHLLPHFTRAQAWRDAELPVIVRGEGCYLYDDHGRRFVDGLAGLFCVNIGHGRTDIPAAAAKQMETLSYWTNWGTAHPASAEAAALVAEIAPGDLDVVFFVNSGSEAVESAVKFVRQFHYCRGQPERTKIIARDMAYHGTTLGALAVTGIPQFKSPFGPLMPGVRHVPNTLGAEIPAGGTAYDLDCVRAIADTIEEEGPETVAAVFAEPVQNSRGALVPPPGYWSALREICDRHGILLVADEVICAYGRLGDWFGSAKYGVLPDLVTFAKGVTSGYAPLGGVVLRRPLVEEMFDSPAAGMFTHGATFGGHPVSTAVAKANLTAMREEDVLGNVRRHEAYLQAGLNGLRDAHPTVLEWRGTGFFYAIELVLDRESGRELTAEQSARLVREVMPRAMREVGLITRPDDRGGTMIMLSPPLVADREILDLLLTQVDSVLDAVDSAVRG